MGKKLGLGQSWNYELFLKRQDIRTIILLTFNVPRVDLIINDEHIFAFTTIVYVLCLCVLINFN